MRQKPDRGNLPRWLCPGNQRRCEQTERERDEEANGTAPHSLLLESLSCLPASCHINEAEPLINRSFCPDKAILAWFSGTFAQCPLSAFAGRYDNGNLICLLARAAVNYPYPSMKSECVGLYEKGTAAKKVVFGIGEIVPKTEGYCWRTFWQ